MSSRYGPNKTCCVQKNVSVYSGIIGNNYYFTNLAVFNLLCIFHVCRLDL
uniref:Uncharacterized protein n=1 Tax=Rhizophora mucronata TaxID=61149 RepID=A0A2P2IZE2_RHIMU